MSMGTGCAPHVADCFCYEVDSMLSISDNNQEDVVDLFDTYNPYFEQMLPHLNTSNSLDTEPPFLIGLLP